VALGFWIKNFSCTKGHYLGLVGKRKHGFFKKK